MKKTAVFTLGLFLFQTSVIAQQQDAEATSESESADNQAPNMEHMRVLGRRDQLATEAGSATLIDELALEKMEYDDIHRILANVPGINIRQEDGYGLRPNIGFRGVTPERSKKINILEDGVLIGPAPYSAPAAYYFPSVNLMTSVEVFKGPAAIQYGPNTVAGTLNMTTRSVPSGQEGAVDLAGGSNGYQKLHGHYGNSFSVGGDELGFLFEALRTSADGFKTIDNASQSQFDEDTGFVKNDFLAKVNYQFSNSMFNRYFDHYVEVKLGYSDEDSNETYMGLTDADFSADPNRRYAVSQVGNMKWDHQQSLLTYNLRSDDISWTNRFYFNEFARAWRKVNGFYQTKNTAIDRTLQQVISDPGNGINQDYYLVLTGQKDSEDLHEQLIVGTNDRSYESKGWQSDLTFSTSILGVENVFNAGVRVHSDHIYRDHFERLYKMQAGVMTSDQDKYFTTVNLEQTDATSVYIKDTIMLDDLELSFGARGEFIDSEYRNRKEGKEQDWLKKSSEHWLYSLSAFYQLNSHAGLFFGVHEGFVPTSPKQPPAIQPEKSINYELGGRYNDGQTKLEVVAFLNDFDNLKESCSFSTSASCTKEGQVDEEYNGGEVDVYGVEFNLEHRVALTDTIDMPVSLIYTYTDSKFQQALASTFELWGDVQVGDPVPYLADNQLTFNIGLSNTNWQFNLAMKYYGAMHEASGRSNEELDIHVPLEDLKTDAYTVLDLSASYDINDEHSVYLKADNLLDEVALVSRRPFGARPSKPQQFFVGYKYRF